MTKRKTFLLKQNLTCANYVVYVSTCNVVIYAINNMKAKQQTYFPAANPTKAILLFAHILPMLYLNHSIKRQCGFAALLD